MIRACDPRRVEFTGVSEDATQAGQMEAVGPHSDGERTLSSSQRQVGMTFGKEAAEESMSEGL